MAEHMDKTGTAEMVCVCLLSGIMQITIDCHGKSQREQETIQAGWMGDTSGYQRSGEQSYLAPFVLQNSCSTEFASADSHITESGSHPTTSRDQVLLSQSVAPTYLRTAISVLTMSDLANLWKQGPGSRNQSCIESHDLNLPHLLQMV